MTYEGLNGKSRLFCVFCIIGTKQRSEPFGVARAACFEQLAGLFASCGALHYAKIFYPHRLCEFRLKLAQAISNFASKCRFWSPLVLKSFKTRLSCA